MWFLIIIGILLVLFVCWVMAKASSNASREEEYMRIKNNIKDE
mgnify:CR=1 FL=1